MRRPWRVGVDHGAVAAASRTPPRTTRSAAETRLEEVIVTGSLITDPNRESPSPIVISTIESLQQSGTATIEAALNQTAAVRARAAAPAMAGRARAATPPSTCMHWAPIAISCCSTAGGCRWRTSSAPSTSTWCRTRSCRACRRSPAAPRPSTARTRCPASSTSSRWIISKARPSMRSTAIPSAAISSQTKASLALRHDVRGGRRPRLAVARLHRPRQAVGKDRMPFFDLLTPSSFIGQGTFVPSATNLPNQATVNTLFTSYGAATPVANTLNLGFNDDGTLFTQTGAKNYKGPTTDDYRDHRRQRAHAGAEGVLSSRIRSSANRSSASSTTRSGRSRLTGRSCTSTRRSPPTRATASRSSAP